MFIISTYRHEKYYDASGHSSFYDIFNESTFWLSLTIFSFESRNENTLYSLWKDIFVKLWKLFKTERYQCIMYDKESWSNIEKEVTLLGPLHRPFHNPLLSGLFDDPDDGVLFRWASITNQEARETSVKGSISTHRPDSCISEMDGLFFGSSLGYVEVKPASEKYNVSLAS
ncbi:hypothetical protein BDC45DRAFT_553138 [Circinella umbellata]|nr:hypothetical protein BDC45DRAFT_553138 [Circinella umbellata]